MHHDEGTTSRRGFLAGAGSATAAAAGSLIGATASDALRQEAKANMAAATRARGYAPWTHGLVHYVDNGATPKAPAPPLLLLHQAPMSSRQFDAGYAPLARRGVRAIGIDTPGFGMSDPTPFVPAIADWVPAVLAVMDHLQVLKADVLGHHTGALIATELALRAPDRVRRVIVNGPFPITPEEREKGLQNVQKNEIDFEYKPDGTHLAESFMRRWTMYGAGADPKLVTRIVVEKFQGFGPFWYGHHAAYRYDHASALQRLNHPTLVLTNTGDPIYPMARRVRDAHPRFAYAELAGGGVDVVDQLAEPWADAITAFVHGPAASDGRS